MPDFQSTFTIQRIKRIRDLYGCSQEDAEKYLDLLEEGYSGTEALLMAGLADPPDPDPES